VPFGRLRYRQKSIIKEGVNPLYAEFLFVSSECRSVKVHVHICNILSCVPQLSCGSMTNNSTWIQIGHRIYSLWRFTAAHITITSY
jgi:hypothetical protein